MKKTFGLIIMIILIFVVVSWAVAYDTNVVHPIITEIAVTRSNLDGILKQQLGIQEGVDKILIGNKTIKEWIMEGGKLEDETDCRTKFHFHDPTKESFDKAGLSNIAIDTWCGNYNHRSSLVWAQDTADNLWSWQKARWYYYEALIRVNKDIKEVRFSETFRTLGQVMHLVSDSSVPAHVRDDIHIFPREIPGLNIQIGRPTYESWAKANPNKLPYTGVQINQSIFNQAVDDPLAPVPISALWDIDKYKGNNPEVAVGTNTGLAEYTNANFFSEDTIFTKYQYPNWKSVSDKKVDFGIIDPRDPDKEVIRQYYVKDKHGDTGYLLSTVPFYVYYGDIYVPYPPILDGEVYQSYASKLIPRAVGYSAGLLDYFFRGKIELTRKSYAKDSVILFAKNVTDGSEEMSGGTVKLVVKYTLDNKVFYIVADEKNGSSSLVIPRNNGIELTFDLRNDPIPADAKDITLQVVYRGKLGKEIDGRWIGEDDAVAVGLIPYVLYIVLQKKTGDTTDWWYYDLEKEKGYHKNPSVPLPSKPEIISKWWSCENLEEVEYYTRISPAFQNPTIGGAGDSCGLVNFKSAQCCEGSSPSPNTQENEVVLPCGGEPGYVGWWYGWGGKHVSSCSECGDGQETMWTPGAQSTRSRTSNQSSHCDKGTSWDLSIGQLTEKMEIGPRQNTLGYENSSIASASNFQCGPYEKAKMCCPVCSQDRCQCTWMWLPAFCGTVCESNFNCEGWHPVEGGGWTSCTNKTFLGTDTYGGQHGSHYQGCAMFDIASRSSGYGTMVADVVTKVKVGAVETTFGGSWSSYSAQEGNESVNNIQRGWTTLCLSCPQGSGQGETHRVAHFSFSETSYGVAGWRTVVTDEGRFAVLIPRLNLTVSATSTDGKVSGSISGPTTALLRVVDIIDENPVEKDFELAKGEIEYSLSGMPSSRDDLGIKPNCYPLDLPLDIDLRGLHWYGDNAFLVTFVLQDVFYAYLLEKKKDAGWQAIQLGGFEQWVLDNNLKEHLMFLN